MPGIIDLFVCLLFGGPFKGNIARCCKRFGIASNDFGFILCPMVVYHSAFSWKIISRTPVLFVGPLIPFFRTFGRSHGGSPQLPASSPGFVIHPQLSCSPDPD